MQKLADIHGQYDHQSLLNPDYHIHLVDLYQKDRILPAKEKVQRLYETYTALRARLKALLEETAKNQREQDFMAYELEELQNAHLQIGEDAELEERLELLQNSGQIYENLAGAYQIASEDECSALSAIKHIADNLTEIASYSQDLSELSQRTNELYYELEDIASSVRDCRDNTVFSPEELDETIERSDLLKRLKNKHGKSIEELIAYAQELEEKLSGIENADALKEQLESQLAQQRMGTAGRLRRSFQCSKGSGSTAGTENYRRTDSAQFQRRQILYQLQTGGAPDCRGLRQRGIPHQHQPRGTIEASQQDRFRR